MISLKYINISVICIVFVSVLFYFSFIRNSSYETIDDIDYYQIEMIDGKECNEFNTKFRYHLIYTKDNHLESDYILQDDNIPWDSINAKKYVLMNCRRTKHTLVFNPLTFEFSRVSKFQYDPKKDKKIVYKK